MANGNPAQDSGAVSEPLQVSQRWQPKANPLDTLVDKIVDGNDIGVPGAPPVQPEPLRVQRQGRQQAPNAWQEAEDVGGQEFQEPQGAPEPPIKGNPFARIRVLEREKRLAEERNQRIEEQFIKLTESLSKLAPQEEEDPEEDLSTLNPIEAISKRQEMILERIESREKQEQEEKEREQITEEERAADIHIQSFIQRAEQAAPGVYPAAVAHLANVKMSEYLDDNPDVSVEDAEAEVGKWARGIKMRALREGKNPAEEFLRRSVQVGFNPNGAVKPQKAPGATNQQQVQPNPAQQIQAEQRRKEALGSLSNMQGTSVQDPIKGLNSLSEKERIRTLMGMSKERGRMNRPIPLHELLAHKIHR